MKKVTKSQLIAQLKKLNEGQTLDVKVIPCKMHPNNEYYSHAGYNHFMGYDHEGKAPFIMSYWSGSWTRESLEKFLNEFTYYNCQYNELGKYPAYYIIGDAN